MDGITFPLAKDVESQENAKIIVYRHYVRKAMQMGSTAGLVFGSILFLTPYQRPHLIRRSANLIGAGFVIPAIGLCYSDMKDKGEIEWKRRAFDLQRDSSHFAADAGSEVALVGSTVLQFAFRYRNYTGISIAAATIAGSAWDWYNMRSNR